MTKYKITTSENKDLGVFEADSEKDALQQLAALHGFFDWAEACDSGEFDDSVIRVVVVD